jgi:alcohol dehydrogenase/propanol-preferring alcohol dehydrogenase
VKVGDLRIVYPWLGCGTCETCLAEEDNMCVKAERSMGVYANGGYGTHVITVYAAIKKAMPVPAHEAIVLVGAGGLGLNAIKVLLAMKHRNIISVDISAEKRDAALKAGAHETVDGNGPDAAKRIIEAAGGPVLAVIDLVNGTQTARFAFGALRKGGKLIQVGLFGGELMLPLPIMAIRALTVQGSYVGNPKELRELIGLAQDGSLNALPVATVPQNRADEALMRLRDGKVTGRLVLKAEAA